MTAREYAEERTREHISNFHDLHEGLLRNNIDIAFLEALESFWKEFAARYRGRPVIFAYDLLNEPNWGYNPRRAIHKQKPELYRRTTEAIREAEKGGLEKIICQSFSRARTL